MLQSFRQKIVFDKPCFGSGLIPSALGASTRAASIVSIVLAIYVRTFVTRTLDSSVMIFQHVHANT